jgi:methyl-accepting chemotaxis protein
MAPNDPKAQKASDSRGFLRTLLLPATLLLDRLRYSRKFLILAVVIVVPLAVVLRLQLESTGYDRDFNYGEVVGVEYISAANRMLVAVEKRRILSAAVLAGESKYQSQLAAVTDEIKARIQDVDVVDEKYNERLKTTEKWNKAKDSWGKLRSLNSTDPAEVDAAHAELSAILIDLILNDAGNNSNLILDPDLDSYWLMDAFVIKLPLMQDAAAAAAAAAIRSGDVDMARVTELVGTLKTLGATTSDLIAVNMTTAVKESRNPKWGMSQTLPLLEPPARDVKAKVDAFDAATRSGVIDASFGKAAPSGKDVTPIVDAALAAVNDTGAFHDKVAPELAGLCQKRVNRYASNEVLGIVLGALAVVLMIYLLLALYYSVATAVRVLGDSATRMVGGNDEAIYVASKDELADIATSMNEINTALVEARTLRARVEDDNRQLQDNIMDLLRVVAEASEGDLRVRAKITEGALGNVADAFNALMESLGGLIGQIQDQLKRTDNGVQAIAEASQRMAAGAGEQTKSVIEATKLVKRMSEEIAGVSQNAQVAADAAKRTETSALEGAAGVQEAVVGMTSLRANVQAGAKKMKNLGDRSMEITGIVATINRISEQTNMLALNAAIEAARAGEHGRGFSVVAEEVRKLAERTASATQEIDRLVKTIHSETAETVDAIEQQTQLVEREANLVGRAGESLAKIRSVSTESAGLVTGITRIAEAQVHETAAVVQTMSDISTIAESTERGAKTTAMTIEELRRLSESLMGSIQRFKLAS